MPRREVLKYLFDIRTACDDLTLFTGGKTFQDYAADRMLQSAVERQFEIIGEALSQLLKVDPELGKSITDHRRIVAFRNRLIHGYANVDEETVWAIVEAMLPRLRIELAEVIAALDTQ